LRAPGVNIFVPALKKIYDRLGRTCGSAQRVARKTMANAVYSLPGLSERRPAKRIVTFKNHCSSVPSFPTEAQKLPGDWYLKVRPAEMIRRQDSVGLSEEQGAQFRQGALEYQNGKQFEIPEVFLASLRDAKICSRDFLVLSSDDRILFESALSKNEVLEKN